MRPALRWIQAACSAGLFGLVGGRQVLGLLIGLLSLGVGLSACSFSLADDIKPPPGSRQEEPAPLATQASGDMYPIIAPDPAAGAAIYAEKCIQCHGPTGLGDGAMAAQLPDPPPALGSPEIARQARPADWFRIVTQGNLEKRMPFNSLNDRQRWDVVAYLYTLSASPESVQAGQALYQAHCAACHGQTGRGDGPQAASLANSPTDFTNQEHMAQQPAAGLFQVIANGRPAEMPAFGAQLSEAERWALTDFLRSLTFATARVVAPTGQVAPEAVTGAETETQATPVAKGAVGAGKVTGSITNASGVGLPDGLIVVLHGYDDMNEVYTQTVGVNPDGSYVFENVEMPLGRAFITSLEYNRVTYGSDVSQVQENMAVIDLPIRVYESTTDTAILSVDRLHIFLEYIQPETLRVVEIYIVSNLGDRTVVATQEGGPVLQFELPPGATNLQFESGVLGGRFIQTPAGFGDTTVIRPGASQHQVVFAFDMPYQRRLDFVQALPLPVNAVVLLIQEDGLKVKGDQLLDGGVRDMQGTPFRIYSSDRLGAGTKLSLSISGQPAGQTASFFTSDHTNLIIGLGAFGLALITAGLWIFRRSRLNAAAALVEQEQAGPTESAEDLGVEDADTLIDAIITLDDQYQAGELPEEAYRSRRAELKRRLKRTGL
jgi:mono/diheme cytochrome c family protein